MKKLDFRFVNSSTRTAIRKRAIARILKGTEKKVAQSFE